MDIDRFEALAQAYGADLARWPTAERPAAEALALAQPGAVSAILAEAALVDGWLSASVVQPPSPSLCDSILAASPRSRRPMRARWAGLGVGVTLAAASIAGIMAGVVAGPIAINHAREQAAADPVSDAVKLLGEGNEMSEG